VNLKAYIKSGILELFVLDLLNETDGANVLSNILQFPVLKKEIEKIESTLEKYAISIAIAPPASLRTKIEASLAEAVKEQEMDMDHLVLISEHSDYRNWLRLVSEYFPKAFESDSYYKVLRHENGVTQALIVSTSEIEEGPHNEFHESFLILQGKCMCTFGKDNFHLGAGGYTQVPIDQHHKVEVRSSRIMAIIQRVSISK
jgi:mannose-6-phosphate isomerase-like protein (cupin superfamily)